jgi:predicted phosphoribosyltransferase
MCWSERRTEHGVAQTWTGRDDAAGPASGRPSAGIFEDRRHAGALLAELVAAEAGPRTLVFGVDRGGVPIAAEVAQRLRAPLDAIGIGHVGHPHRPGEQLGARTAEGPPTIDPRGGALSPSARAALDARLADAATDARELDAGLHRLAPRLDPTGAVAILVTDVLASAAPAVAASRWAGSRRAARTVVAVPLASERVLAGVEDECTAIRCLHVRGLSVGTAVWRHDRDLLGTAALAELISAQRAGRA